MRTSDYVRGLILELRSPIPGRRHGLKRPRLPAVTLATFYCRVGIIQFSSLYEATENELQGSGMKILKKSTRVLEVTDFEIIAFPPTSTMKLKGLMLKL